MIKTKPESFLLADDFNENLTRETLVEVTAKYKARLQEANLLFPYKETLDIMLWAKRRIISFGPYQNLTFFEISNRIYSDLVLLEAAAMILNKKNIKAIQLNMSNRGGNDMTIFDDLGDEIIGEAFNTACSFFQIKLSSELKKFRDDKAGFIAFNKTALDERNIKHFEKKRNVYKNIEFIICNI